MDKILEKDALNQIANTLKEWLEAERLKIAFHQWLNNSEVDLIVNKEPFTFLIEFKSDGGLSLINSAIDHLKRSITANETAIVAVPFMGEAGRKLCKEKQVSWMDLSGNAYIKAPGLLINIQGKPNKFVRVGRPQNLFAAKSSRITRYLLMNSGRAFTQRELSIETNLDEGMVSKVVREMENVGFLIRDEIGALKAKDPDILLDAWREKYSFLKHHIIKGFIPERSSGDVLRKIASTAEAQKVFYAACGLSGAWLLTHFANYKLATIYLEESPGRDFLEAINFIDEKRGGNTWFVVPNDHGVFVGASTQEGIRCAHPLQIYLDLKDMPERAREAADSVRKEYLRWNK